MELHIVIMCICVYVESLTSDIFHRYILEVKRIHFFLFHCLKFGQVEKIEAVEDS